nr:hypothetical protein [Tanacetum cinerariifolium]
AAPPKTKASVRKMHSSSDTTMPPLTDADIRLSTSAKGKQPATSYKAKGPSVLSENSSDEDDDDDQSDDDIHDDQKDEDDQDDDDQDDNVDDQNDNDDDKDDNDDDQDDNDNDQDSVNDDDDFVRHKFSTHDEEDKDEESFDPIVQTPSHVENFNDEGNDDESHGINVKGDEGSYAENDDEELYGDVNINLEGRDVQMTDVHTTQVIEDTHVTLTPVNPDGQQHSSFVSSKFVSNTLNPSPDAGIDSLFESTPQVDVPVTTTVVPLLVTAPTLPPPSIPIISQFAEAVSSIPGIVDTYIDHQMNEAIKVAVQLQSDRIRDEAQAKNEDFLNKLDENIQKIIKEQVKEQVKVQVSKILPKIKKTITDQLDAEVLTRASNSSKTSYDVAADLSELELKKILIEKMETNKSIYRSDEQRNLYKALVDAYECDKIILDTYRDTITLKRRRDDEDKDEEPSAGSNQEKSQRQPVLQRKRQEPMHITQDLEEPAHKEFETGATDDQPIAEASQHPEWFQKQTKLPSLNPFLLNRLKLDTLTLELLAGPTYELMKGSCKSLVELEFFLEEPLPLIPNSRGRRIIPFDHFINNDLEYLRSGASSQKYTTSVTTTKAADYGHIKWIEDLVPRIMWSQTQVNYDKYALWGISHWGHKCQQFYGSAVNRESARDVYSKRRMIAVIELQIVEWHNYKHLDWITMRRDDDKLYKFKEGYFMRLRIQDIEDMLLLLKLNLIKPDTYRTELKHKEAYTAYSNIRGFIYQNRDKQSKLMRIDELNKFNDDTLNDVRTALDDHLKGI